MVQYISEKIDFQYNTYYEPFLGGGALLLYLSPSKAVCSDINPELINFYNVVKKCPKKLIAELKNEFVPKHSKDFFYEVRAWDRNSDFFKSLDDVKRAARFIYLNKNCYNGLWRENHSGQNNVPMGKYLKLNLPKDDDILRVSRYFQHQDIRLKNCDYNKCIENAGAEDLVYMDPPYDVDDSINGFVDYSQGGFTKDDQKKLKECCDDLVQRGAMVMISNSDTAYIRELYGNQDIYTIYDDKNVYRFVGANVDSRRKVTELLIVGRGRHE